MNSTTVSLASVTSLAVGVALGYVIAMRRLEQKYIEISLREIEEARETYKIRHKEGDYETPEKAAAASGVSPQPVYGTPESLPTVNVEGILNRFTTTPDVPIIDEKPVHILDAELLPVDGLDRRDPGKPYLVSDTEYEENATFAVQEQLTYYADHDILVDSEGDRMELETSVGLDVLGRFGPGQAAPNRLLVHNPEINVLYEVLRAFGDIVQEY